MRSIRHYVRVSEGVLRVVQLNVDSLARASVAGTSA